MNTVEITTKDGQKLMINVNTICCCELGENTITFYTAGGWKFDSDGNDSERIYNMITKAMKEK